MDKVVVLGGSSPFTVALVDAMRSAGLPPVHLVLHGRDQAALARVHAFAQRRLPSPHWRVSTATDLQAAIAGARIVVVQIRFGGLEGRMEDERIASRFGLPADETLGPSGLYSALRQASPIRALGRTLADGCPDAWVLNLINPLSLSCRLLAESGVRRMVGICELPLQTVESLAALFDVHPGSVDWHYHGLNHRGFVTRAIAGERDLIAALPDKLGDARFLGIDARTVSALQALPLKYFALLTESKTHAGRAEVLMDLRRRALSELHEDPASRPAALSERQMPWYERAVVPIMGALLGGHPFRTTVNLDDGSGCVRERPAWVSADSVATLDGPRAPDAVSRWNALFEAHELACLAAVAAPGRDTLRHAIAQDPLVPERLINEVTDAIGSAFSH